MVKAHFNRDIADPLLYDCVWNADTASFEAMAESLMPLIRRRASLEPRAAAGDPRLKSEWLLTG